MFRNHYDHDVTIWSPQGRLHQVEYAAEAVKMGAPIVGLKNRNHAVLVSLKRAASALAQSQKKVLQIDTMAGISFAGLTSDVKILSKFLRTECINYRYIYNAQIPTVRIVEKLGEKMHIATQRYGMRPYGVGILIAGYDGSGPRIFEVCNSGNYFDCKAMTLGSRCQSARTYLEKHVDTFVSCDLNETVKHGLRALQSTLPSDSSLSTSNVSVGIVGSECTFKTFDNEEVATYLRLIEGEDHRPDAGAAGEAGDSAEINDADQKIGT